MMRRSTRGSSLRAARLGAIPLVFAFILAGCASPQPTYRYMQPTTPSAPAPRVVVGMPLDAAQRQVRAALESASLEVVHADPRQRVLVAHYSGEPSPYVDCGVLVRVGSGEGDIDVLPAAAAASPMTDGNVLYDRRMRLDSRLLVRFEPQGRQTAIVPEATYVLSKVMMRPGTSLWGRETISFSSGEDGGFAKGTTCHPTGALEALPQAGLQEAALALAAVPAAPVAGGGAVDLTDLALSAVPEGGCAAFEAIRTGAGAVVLSGIVSDLFTMDSVVNALTFSDPDLLVENRLAVLSAPACEAYRLLEPYRGGDGAGLGLEIANLGQLAGGEDLRLALRLPADRTNLHIVQFLDEDTVGQLELAARSAAPGMTWSIDTGHAAGAADQQSLVLAVATEAPLFASARPPVEPADAFLPALREALARQGVGRSAPVAACAIVAVAAEGDGAAESEPDFC
jgi:hypothetical protein